MFVKITRKITDDLIKAEVAIIHIRPISVQMGKFFAAQDSSNPKLELMFMKHYAPNRCLYIKVAKLRTGVGSAEMSHLQNRCLKISG